jgi:RNA polymerase sigma-70 factor (ECF subfamily)
MPDPDDQLAGLLKRVAQQDEASFASLYDATSRRVFGLALKILRDPSAAEEAALESYTYVWRQASRYDPVKASVMTWILTITRSRAIDSLRSRMRRNERELPLEPISSLQDPSPDPESASVERQRKMKVRRALESLPRKQREVIETAYFTGLSYSEVAATLGEPLGTIKTRIRAGLSSLRRIRVRDTPRNL